jgi:hypothetical protein
MEKDKVGHYHGESNLSLNKLSNEELEISSTGYGLESVSKEKKGEGKGTGTNQTGSSCGGL